MHVYTHTYIHTYIHTYRGIQSLLLEGSRRAAEKTQNASTLSYILAQTPKPYRELKGHKRPVTCVTGVSSTGKLLSADQVKNICMYVYIYMCVCVYVYMYVCDVCHGCELDWKAFECRSGEKVYVCIHIHMCVCTCMYVYDVCHATGKLLSADQVKNMCIYTYTYARMYVCVQIR